MADTTNIPTGLSVQTQIPLDTIKFIQNESLLSNLGQNNNLAFKYYDGLIIKCIDQNTFYIWREVQRGEENTGIINVDFTYPFNHSAFGMNYSNKKFNFFLYNKEYSIVNTGSGFSIFKDKTISFNNTQFNLKKIKTDNLLITDGTSDILINQKAISSNSISVVNNNNDIKVEVLNLQKTESTFPYTFTANDDKYTIFINNGAFNVTLQVPLGLPSNFCCTLIQKGNGNVTVVPTGGSTLSYPATLSNVIKGQYFWAMVEKETTINEYYLIGSLKSI